MFAAVLQKTRVDESSLLKLRRKVGDADVMVNQDSTKEIRTSEVDNQMNGKNKRSNQSLERV
jgi:hypothetical protein